MGKGTLYLICTLYRQAAGRISTSFCRNFAVLRVSCAEVLLEMQRCDISCAKRAVVLSGNEILEIVMDSDSDEDKYYGSEESEDEVEPCPP